jgi:serine/threonine protein kinase
MNDARISEPLWPEVKGQIIGNVGKPDGASFEIVGVLGEGATGIVYDAFRLPMRDRVALKVIHRHLMGDRQIHGRFVRETAILKRIEGAHLCPILVSGELPDPRDRSTSLLFLALRKIEGGSLADLISREGPLAIDRVIDLMMQVCLALEAAHAQGVVHRDLKPANVLVEAGSRAFVVDFGLGKIVRGEGGTGTTDLTTHNMVFGTPEYMSPEQARGDELDERCDIYAAGVILYELVTGTVPFRGASSLTILTAHLTEPLVAPRTRAPDRNIPAAIDAVITFALAKDPRDRYDSAASLNLALERARTEPLDASAVHPSRFARSARVRAADPYGVTLIDRTSSITPDPRSVQPAPIEQAPAIAPLPKDGPTHRRWTLVWILAAALSITLGAWLAWRAQ